MIKTKSYLGRTINRIFDDGGTAISRRTIRLAVEGDWNLIRNSLKDWETAGFLRIVRDPESAGDAEICVELIEHIPICEL